MTINAIDIQNVTVRFGQTVALSNLSLSVKAGEVLGIIGPTAAGKTVLLKTLAGLYKPQTGSLFIDGNNISDRDAHITDRIGMLFQQNALFDSMTIWENIAFRAINSGLSRVEARAQVAALLPRVGLSESAGDLMPSDLSGGMQKRVGFARAIFSKPDFLLLDNPTAGLDPILAARIEKMIQSMARESGATVLSVTGNMTHIHEAYDVVAVLHDGVLHWQGPAAEAHSNNNPYLRQLIEGRRDGPIQANKSVA